MSWRKRETVGDQMVAAAHDLLRIEDRYLVEDRNGFTFWAGELATRVRADEGLFRQGQVTYRVTAETEMVRGRGHMAELINALEHELDQCSFSGAIYNRERDVFSLHTSIYASGDNAEWLQKVFCAAVALQAAEAHSLAEKFSRTFHASVAMSEHPQNGLRTQKDLMLTEAWRLFHPSGDQPSRWINSPEWQRCEWVMERESISFQSDRATHLKAEFPWHGNEGHITLQVTTDEPHPTLGNGLHCTLTIPLRLNPTAIGHLSLELNTFEHDEYKRCHTLGSWCDHDDQLAFRTFIPNALHTTGAIEDVCVALSTRAIWVDEWFMEKRRQAQSQSAQA